MIRMEGSRRVLSRAYVGMAVGPGELEGKSFLAPSFGHAKVWTVHCLFQCLVPKKIVKYFINNFILSLY